MAKDKAKAKESKKTTKKPAKEEAPKKKGFPPKKAGGAAKKSKKKPMPIFKAPEDFKPFFSRVSVKIDKDGIISDVGMIRLKGSPTNENAKTVNMALLDPDTLRRFASRYCAVAFVRSDKKRLPGSSVAQMILRVSMNKETRAIKCSCKDIRFKEGKDGKVKALDKKDPKYRVLRKPMRFIPAAFTKVGPFPSAADLKALLKSSEE